MSMEQQSAPAAQYHQPAPQKVDSFGKPTAAIVGASWAGLALGMIVYCASLWRADLDPFQKALLLGVLVFGVMGATTLQKAVRDRHEGVPVTSIFVGVAWAQLLIALGFMGWASLNLPILPSEVGTYAGWFVVSILSVIFVQKNVRDQIAYKARHPELYGPDAVEARRQTSER